MTSDTIIHLILAAGICAALLRRGRQGPPGATGPQGEAGAPGAPGKDATLPAHLMLAPSPSTVPPAGGGRVFRVHRLKDGEWEPGEWVREATPAWTAAYETPGIALQADGDMVLGVQ